MAKSSNSTNPSGSESSGLNLKKFNSTSVTTTTEVITPIVSSADKGRRATMVAVVIVAVAFLGFMAFRTSGFNPFEKTEHEKGFIAPEHSSPQ